MEKKTIGGFIATLRKANGMTQKDLAEKLNVSDKTVSRWERDDGTPDLSVIPVIAEIFGVTCDELLRGERRPAAAWQSILVQENTNAASGEAVSGDGIGDKGAGDKEATEDKDIIGKRTAAFNAYTMKGEKQRRRILSAGLSKYKTKTFIAIGISVSGLIAAMIGNIGFLRAYIGFLAGAFFYLAGIVCQAIFVNGAFLTVSDEDLEEQAVGKFKWSVIRLAEWSIGTAVVLFGFTMPLIVFVRDTYNGLSSGTWFRQGASYALLILLLYCMICYFLNHRMLELGVYCLEEKAEQIYRANHIRKRKCVIGVLCAWVCTFVLHIFVTEALFSITDLSESIQFHDYESFVTYMEQDIPYEPYSEYGTVSREQATEEVAAPSSEIIYYDQYGNEISEEEALRRELTDSEGNVVCEYMARNEKVASVRYSDKDGDLLPLTVVTHDALRRGRARMNMIQNLFLAAYGLEVLAGMMVYFRRRER